MGRNIWAIGDRSISGQFRRVMSAGDINIEDGDIKSLYSAGDVNITNSTIKKLRSAGDIKAQSSVFGNFKGIGDVRLKGICKADIFVAMGDLRADFLECNVLRNFTRNRGVVINGISNVMEWSGDFKVETFESLYDFNLSCQYDFQNIISYALLSCPDELACERLYSFGPLQAGCANAEYIFIVPKRGTIIQSLVGSNINISKTFKVDKTFKKIAKSVKHRDFTEEDEIISLSSIEGDNINIENTKAQVVSGIDVTIGDLCIVERVEYRDNIKISEKAIVNEVVKL